MASGGRAVAIQADVSNEQQIIHMFKQAESELGPIKALVNNAAVTGGFARVEEVSSAAIAKVFAVNVSGTMLCSREAVRRMSTGRGGTGGAIVNLSSIAARTGAAGEWAHYAASKGAIDSFTIGLAREVAAEGIRVNAVAPGFVDTRMTAWLTADPDLLEGVSATIPLRRIASTADIARVIVALSTEAFAYVTGQTVIIDGGWSL